jgi:hypothetical protein
MPFSVNPGGKTYNENYPCTLLTILMLLPVSAMGEILTIKHTVRQTFGGGQSPDDARISGINHCRGVVDRDYWGQTAPFLLEPHDLISLENIWNGYIKL